jgi:hypothetical protein
MEQLAQDSAHALCRFTRMKVTAVRVDRNDLRPGEIPRHASIETCHRPGA